MLHYPKLKNEKGYSEICNKFLGPSYLWNFGFKSLSFDFFINWEKKHLEKSFYIKKCFFEGDFKNPNEYNVDELNYIDNPNFYIMIFNENEYSENMKILLIKKTDKFEYKFFGLNQLKERILNLTGKKFKIGMKGLTWFTTQLEKGLSNTEYLWAGDCDSMLFDNNKKPIAILEYQKTSVNPESFLSNGSPFAELYFGKTKNQKVKYDRLFILAKEFSDIEIPVFIIYYHTNDSIKFIGLEKFINNKSVFFEKISFEKTKEETFAKIGEYFNY